MNYSSTVDIALLLIVEEEAVPEISLMYEVKETSW